MSLGTSSCSTDTHRCEEIMAKVQTKKQGVHHTEERTLGGEAGIGQDVSIFLVPKGASKDQKLALIHLHSHVLSSHSKYFNTCLSERWKKSTSPSTSIEFVLEVHTDVKYYFDCFAAMYPPVVKTFEGVKHGVELLKVASLIDFQELMEHISLYLSTMYWSEEDTCTIQEYSTSPGFPRIHLQDLVTRLGLDESKEERQKQLCDIIRECSRAMFEPVSIPKGVRFPEFLQGIGCHGMPSDFSEMVIGTVSQEAKDMFANIEKQWTGKVPSNPPSSNDRIESNLESMCWILEALLKEQVAEELVQGIVHFDAIPKYIDELWQSDSYKPQRKKILELVLKMYKEVAAGRLLLRPPERLALLANWHEVMNSKLLNREEVEQATANLFLTLPLKQQRELINLHKEKIDEYIGATSLISMVSKHKIS